MRRSKVNRALSVMTAVATLVCGPLASAGESQSFKLNVVGGKALVNKGEGFVPVAGSTSLKAGDRVAVLDGNARIVQSGGCAVKLAPRSITTVESGMSCNPQAQSDAVEVVAQQADRRPPSPVLFPAPGTLAGFPIGALVAGGGIALTVGLVIGLSGNGNNNRTLIALLLAARITPLQPVSP